MRVASGSGVFEDEGADIWMDFFSLLRHRAREAPRAQYSPWCPSHTLRDKGCSLDPSMLAAVSSIISSLGEDPLRKELVETPSRFLNWLMNFNNSSPKLDSKILSIHHRSSSSEERILSSEYNLPFWSQCEHHLLPFYGAVHLGYYGLNAVGRSLVQSVVDLYGFKLQVQERLTRQIVEAVSSLLGEEDAVVVVEATHSCMISRGIEKFGSSTATIAVLGRFSANPSAMAEFLQGIPQMLTPL